MQEARIDKSELERLVAKLERSPTVLKEAKRQAFEAAAPKLKAAVQTEIGGTGKVKSWQEGYVGSKGGYAAARPKAETWTERTKKTGKRYAVGYVTNAINSGHRFPSPSGRKGYRPDIRSGAMRVRGREFYQRAQAQAEGVAQEAAEQILDALRKNLEE